ncbi:hypothetical protein [Paraburkholderia sp.]|uniref:hypothetical protein n=1 Tax=Paraburkholderia sp. TaxID=1926495 RepID=UPI00238B4AD3|nr:hypothetical protein [Paraburkholderia sp.]MDE1179795.1 hypothetical protein [Paraburkholderia sp.]
MFARPAHCRAPLRKRLLSPLKGACVENGTQLCACLLLCASVAACHDDAPPVRLTPAAEAQQRALSAPDAASQPITSSAVSPTAPADASGIAADTADAASALPPLVTPVIHTAD